MGASAVVSTAISIGFAVTGISAKIDKAASNVFGKDLVKFANIAGSIFAISNGGFDIGGGGEVVAPGAEAASGASADSLFDADWAAAAGGDGGAMAGEVVNGNVFEAIGATGAEDALYDFGYGMEGDVPLATEQAATNLLSGEQTTGIGTDGKLAATAKTPDPAANAPEGQGAAAQATPTATAQTAAGANAAGAKAAAPTMTSAQAAQMQRDIAAAGKAAGGGNADSSNLFTRIFTNKDGSVNGRMAGAAMQGVGMVAQGIAQSSEANKARAWQSKLYNARPTGIVRQ